jgi:hypothetical protein
MMFERKMLKCDPLTKGLAPTISVTKIYARLTEIGFSERAVQVLTHNADFAVMRYRSHQICFITHYAKEIFHRVASRNELVVVFEANIMTVDRTLSRGLEDPQCSVATPSSIMRPSLSSLHLCWSCSE